MLFGFDFQALGRELRTDDAYEKSSKNARTLVRGAELTIVLVALKAGARLKEHHSSGPATVIVLEGEIDFLCPEQDKTFRPGALQSVVFSGSVQHSVEARKDSLVLVVFGQKD